MWRRPFVFFLLFAGLTGFTVESRAQSDSRSASEPDTEITSRVLDADTGLPLSGAIVALDGDEAIRTATDSTGLFRMSGVAPGPHTLRVRHPGYLTQTTKVVVPVNEELSILLVRLPDLSEQVTVTAVPWAAERHSVAQATDSVDMTIQGNRSGLSVGEAVKDIPGVRNVSTGEAAGVPMIRGLTNDRVRVLTQGFPHDYFQFSRRHMPNIEPFDASAIEVVRGPGSVLYGSQAVGGIVNLIPKPLLQTEGPRPVFGGDLLIGYSGGSDAWVTRGEVDLAHRGLSGRAACTRRSSGNISTPGGDLPNTDYDQQSALAEGAFRFGNGIRLGGHYQHWQNDLGFFIPATPDFRLALRNDIARAEARVPSVRGEWHFAANISRNVRCSFPNGSLENPAVELELDTQIYRAGFRHGTADQGPIHGWIQVEHGRQENQTLGPVALLPRFRNRTWSAAVFEEIRFRSKELDRWIVSLGLRYDNRRLEVPAGEVGIEQTFRKSYQPVTASIGVVHRFTPALSAGFSLARGWRNPSEFELFADGPHDGVALYEKGNPGLRPETNLNTEASLRWDSRRLRGYLAAYRYGFENYIHLRLTGEVRERLPVSTFDQKDATIRGVEASLAWDASGFLQLSATGETLRTKNEATGARLPFTPPDRAAVGLRLHSKGGAEWSSPYAELRATCTGEGRIAGLDEPFPYNTRGYVLFDVGSGVQRVVRDSVVALDLWIGNLTNRAYKDFLDTYKVYAFSPGRNIRLTARWLF
jgi:iron complex outermembrane receptor protein